MPGSANASFIPKHTQNKGERKSSPRQIFLGTILVRVLFFAVLVAAAVTFVYERKLSNQLAVEVTNFTTAASAYNTDEEKLAIVKQMDNRLRQASDIFLDNVSTVVIFEAIEDATVVSAQFTSVNISREKPEELQIVATLETDTFDSTLFQRSIFNSSDILASAVLEDVSIGKVLVDGGLTGDETRINFTTSIVIDPEDIPNLLIRDNIFVPVKEPEIIVEATSTDEVRTEDVKVEVGFSNDEEI